MEESISTCAESLLLDFKHPQYRYVRAAELDSFSFFFREKYVREYYGRLNTPEENQTRAAALLKCRCGAPGYLYWAAILCARVCAYWHICSCLDVELALCAGYFLWVMSKSLLQGMAMPNSFIISARRKWNERGSETGVANVLRSKNVCVCMLMRGVVL